MLVWWRLLFPVVKIEGLSYEEKKKVILKQLKDCYTREANLSTNVTTVMMAVQSAFATLRSRTTFHSQTLNSLQRMV